MQSEILTFVGGSLLVAACLPGFLLAASSSNDGANCRVALLVSVLFSGLVLALRAATLPAAILGGLVCFLFASMTSGDHFSLRNGLSPLIALFVLTFASTRIARARGVRSSETETRKGRRASQIVANLGIAGLSVWASRLPLPALSRHFGHTDPALLLSGVLLTAALAEATADTVASELGQAFGGQPRMAGTWRPVPPGTDGAITLTGTTAGVLGAGLIAATGLWALHLPVSAAVFAWLGGVAGLFFDTLLGATVERRGWLGNDLVNFSSTAFATLCAAALLLLWR